MNTRTRTIASFFSVAMAAMLLGAVVTTQIHRPQTALARPAEAVLGSSADAVPRPGGPITLDTFRDVARLQTPGVVNVNTTRKVATRQRGGGQDPFRDFFGDDLMDRFFGGPQGGPDSQTQRSLGSGFVVDKDGYILTNRHVVEGADKIFINMADGKRFDAKLVGKDARTDVALLKIEPKGNLTVLNLGDSDRTEVGEWVMAVGNPFGLSGNSVTVGVVSFKGRPLPLNTQANPVEMIQTDASINPGNSGGPLLNTKGEVIGINTLIITQGLPQSAGVGFAVPINVAKEILPQLRDKGRVIRGWLGVQIQPVSEDMAKTLRMTEAKGAIISDVTRDSPAEKAGLKAGDVVVNVDGRAIDDHSALSRYIASKAPGSTVRLQVLRDGSPQTLSLTLGTFPEEGDRDEAVEARAGQMGMTLRDLTPGIVEQLQLPRGTRGVVVTSVEAGEAAEEAGLQRGDVIVSVNGEEIEDVAEFDKEIAKAKGDGMARLRVRRGNSHQFLILKLG